MHHIDCIDFDHYMKMVKKIMSTGTRIRTYNVAHIDPAPDNQLAYFITIDFIDGDSSDTIKKLVGGLLYHKSITYTSLEDW